jgi:hypothetical protein
LSILQICLFVLLFFSSMATRSAVILGINVPSASVVVGSAAVSAEINFGRLKVPDLRKLLLERSLAITGLRNDLLERYKEALAVEAAAVKERAEVESGNQTNSDKVAEDLRSEQEEIQERIDESNNSAKVSAVPVLEDWMLLNNFRQDKIDLLQGWDILSLAKLSQHDLLIVLPGGDGIRLQGLLKKYQEIDLSKDDVVPAAALSRKRGLEAEDSSLRTGSSKSGAMFIDLDGVYYHHNNKTEGANLVIRAGIMRRICGNVLLLHYTEHNNIDFSAKEIMEKLQVRLTKYTILRFVTTDIEDPSQHLNDNVFDLNKLMGIQVFQDMDILEALLTCKGNFTQPYLLSLLSFSTQKDILINLNSSYDIKGYDEISKTVENLERTYGIVGGRDIWMNCASDVKQYVTSAAASTFLPSYLLFLLLLGYATFLEGASTLLHTDKLVAIYASRGQEGWRDYLVLNLRAVFSANKQGQEDFLRHIAPTIVWRLPSGNKSEIKDKLPKGKDSATVTGVKQLCGKDLAFKLGVIRHGQPLSCKHKGCKFAHLSLASFTRKQVLERLPSVPDPLRTTLRPLIKDKSFVGFKK